MRMEIRPAARLARLTLASALLALFSLAPAQLGAQARSIIDWRMIAELSGIVGGTWLEGPRAPTVSSSFGAILGLGLERGVGETSTAGVILRGGQQGLRMKESGASWDGGTLTEVNFVGLLSLHPRRRTSTRISLDLGAGAAILTGASDVIPFQGTSSLSPMGELGVSLRRGRADGEASRQDYSVHVRYSTMRLDMLAFGAEATSGWVNRVSVGLRVTR